MPEEDFSFFYIKSNALFSCSKFSLKGCSSLLLFSVAGIPCLPELSTVNTFTSFARLLRYLSCSFINVHYAYELGAVSMGDDHLTKVRETCMIITLCCHTFRYVMRIRNMISPDTAKDIGTNF